MLTLALTAPMEIKIKRFAAHAIQFVVNVVLVIMDLAKDVLMVIYLMAINAYKGVLKENS